MDESVAYPVDKVDLVYKQRPPPGATCARALCAATVEWENHDARPKLYPLVPADGAAGVGPIEGAAWFENHEPNDEDERDPTAFAALRDAVLARSVSERAILDAVEQAHAQGYSWAFIGQIIGTSGEAARQRYGHKSDA